MKVDFYVTTTNGDDNFRAEVPPDLQFIDAKGNVVIKTLYEEIIYFPAMVVLKVLARKVVDSTSEEGEGTQSPEAGGPENSGVVSSPVSG